MQNAVCGSMRELVLKTERATLYVCGAFGVRRIEVRSVSVERGPYAQYASALWTTFTEKGKRKPRVLVDHRPFVLILGGWGHPEPSSAFVTSADGTTVRSRYSSFDERYQTDFEAQIAPYLERAEVRFDSRKTCS